MNITTIPVGEINRLRRRAQAAVPYTPAADGWTISPVEPMRLLAAFETLRMKTGFALRGYLFRSGNDGNGIVWAMPIDEPQPSPHDCPKIEGFLSPPKPTSALVEVMRAIEGDGSPFSYLSASLLARELCEFGALWHGISWGVAKIIDRRPAEVEKPPIGRFAESHEWPSKLTLCGPPPRSWRPQVTRTANGVEVTFCVLNIVGRRTITRLTDTYSGGEYAFSTTEQTIATGGGGIIW